MSNQLHHDTIGAMIHLLRRHRCSCETEVKNLNIHHSQHRILIHIERCGKNPPTQVEIAQHFHISPAAVAVTLKKLETAGYITRCARSEDMRNNEVTLTASGKKICKDTKDAFDALDRKMFAGLGEKDILQIKKYIDIMLNNLSEGEKE